MALEIEDTQQQAEQPPRWYVVHTYSGYENKVRENLLKRIESMDAKDMIFDVVVPTQKEVEIKQGQRRDVERKLFPAMCWYACSRPINPGLSYATRRG